MCITLRHKVSRQLLQQQWVLETFDGTETESLRCQYIVIQGKAFTHVFGSLPRLPLSKVTCIHTRICSHIPHLLLMITKWRHNAELSHHTHLHCNRVWWKSQNYDLPVGSSKGERGMGKKMPLLYTQSAVRCTNKDVSEMEAGFAQHA